MDGKPTPSSMSKYHRALKPTESEILDDPEGSHVSIMEKFNTVYESLTTQPVIDDYESELQDSRSSPVLESRPVVEGIPPSFGVLTRAPASPHITVTASDGRRVYLNVKQSEVSTNKFGCVGDDWLS